MSHNVSMVIQCDIKDHHIRSKYLGENKINPEVSSPSLLLKHDSALRKNKYI